MTEMSSKPMENEYSDLGSHRITIDMPPVEAKGVNSKMEGWYTSRLLKSMLNSLIGKAPEWVAERVHARVSEEGAGLLKTAVWTVRRYRRCVSSPWRIWNTY